MVPVSGWHHQPGQERSTGLSNSADKSATAARRLNRRKSMRTRLAIIGSATALAISGWASSAFAHHAFAAEFDANKAVNFKGTITKMEWTNPHSWLHVMVKQPDGTTVNWAIEAGTPNVLFRRGFTKETLVPGTEVVVDGYQAKDGSNRANGRDLTLPDGRQLFLGSSGTGAPYELPPNTQ
jgi:hypothetical protein